VEIHECFGEDGGGEDALMQTRNTTEGKEYWGDARDAFDFGGCSSDWTSRAKNRLKLS
jgi:hypothetical protein